MVEGMFERKDYSYTKLKRMLSKKGILISDYDLILIPVNITHSHWLFLSLNYKYHTVHVYDSLKPSSNTVVELRYLSVLEKFLTDSSKSMFEGG